MAIYRRCACAKATGKRYGQLPERPTDQQRANACPRMADPKHGKWGFALSRGITPDGKRRPQVRESNFDTKRDAQRAYAEAKSQHDNGTYVEPTKETLAKYLDAWLDGKIASGEYGPNTASSRRRCITRFIAPSSLGEMRLTDIRRADVRAFFQGLNLTPSMVDETRKALSRALNDAVSDDIIAVNPASRLRLPKPSPKERQWLTPEQMGRLLDVAAAHRLGDLYVVAMFTGLRRGEIAGLRWVDVDLEQRTLAVNQARVMVDGKVMTVKPKTASSRRTVSLESAASEALIAWQMRQSIEREQAGVAWNETGYVFTMEDGSPVMPDYIYRQMREFCDRAGVPYLTFHGQRHQAASLLMEGGADLVLVQQRLGHKDHRTTANIYSHLIGDASRDAAQRASSLVPRNRTAQPLHNAGVPANMKKAPAPLD